MEKLAKFGISLLTLLVAIWPCWFYLIARLAFEPQGFWQNLVLFGAGVWCLGAIQLFMLIIWAVFTIHLWRD